MPLGVGVLTAEFKINLVAPATGDRIVARARVVKAGRTLTLAQTDVVAVADGKEKLIALLTATLMSIEGRDGANSIECGLVLSPRTEAATLPPLSTSRFIPEVCGPEDRYLGEIERDYECLSWPLFSGHGTWRAHKDCWSRKSGRRKGADRPFSRLL
jgi:hypothetical protein